MGLLFHARVSLANAKVQGVSASVFSMQHLYNVLQPMSTSGRKRSGMWLPEAHWPSRLALEEGPPARENQSVSQEFSFLNFATWPADCLFDVILIYGLTSRVGITDSYPSAELAKRA
jgi:hypothetical protein